MRIPRTIPFVILALFLIGCADKEAGIVNPGPAQLTLIYEADTYRTWAGCGSATNSGHGTVKNTGGSDAVGCYVTIQADCETYSLWLRPRSLAPGQFGEFNTGPFNGRQATVRVTAGYEGD